jgi:C1A family cysteine protease
MMLSSDYPYVGKQTSCQYDASKSLVKTTLPFHGDNTTRNVKLIKAAVAKGPVSAAVEADKAVFQMYKSGIFDDEKCGTHPDQAVAIVGYGKENEKEYWIVRQSWGTSWGDQGYIRIAITEGDGICGINKEGVYYAHTVAAD